jgi:hypothetical protein
VGVFCFHRPKIKAMTAMDRMVPSQSLIFIAEILAIFSSFFRLRRSRIGLSTALQRNPDQFDQRLIPERFSQKAYGSGSHGSFFDPLFRESGDENYRHIHPGALHALLNLQTGHAGHLHVDHGAIHIMRPALGRQKLFAGCKCPHLHPPGVQQALQRMRHRGIIVDDMDKWRNVWQTIVPLSSASKRRFLMKQFHHYVSIRQAGGLEIGP